MSEMSEIQVIQAGLALLLYVAAVVFILVFILEIRFRIASNMLMLQLHAAVEKLGEEGTMQSTAALSELRKTVEKVQMMKESQAKLTMRYVTYVLGNPRK